MGKQRDGVQGFRRIPARTARSNWTPEEAKKNQLAKAVEAVIERFPPDRVDNLGIVTAEDNTTALAAMNSLYVPLKKQIPVWANAAANSNGVSGSVLRKYTNATCRFPV